MRYILSIAVCLHLLSYSLSAQESIGLTLERYAGVNGLQLNPSSGAHFSLGWDFNLAGANLFLGNNYAYLSPTNIPKLIKNTDQVQLVDYENSGTNQDGIIADFRNDNKPRFFNLNAVVFGPSLMINIGRKHSVGFFTKLRVQVGSANIDNDLSFYKYRDIPVGAPLEVDPYSINGMVWQEFGGHYSHSVETYNGIFTLGANLKVLRAYEGFYMNVNQPVFAHKLADDSLFVDQFDLSVGYTKQNLTGEDFNPQISGTGFGVDLGATWYFDTDDEGDYLAKVGVSLLDIGKVNFDKGTVNYRYVNTESTELSAYDFMGVNSDDEVFEALSSTIIGNPDDALQPAGFGLWTPSAISIQGDVQIKKNLYVAGALVQGIRISKNTLHRNNTLTLFPRIENRWFTLGIPTSIYNWQDFRVGTTVRIGYLTIGTDKIGSFLGKKAISGTDLYFALKVNPFNLNIGGKGKKRGKGKSVKCFKF